MLSCAINTGALGSPSLLRYCSTIAIAIAQHHHTNNNPSFYIFTSTMIQYLKVRESKQILVELEKSVLCPIPADVHLSSVGMRMHPTTVGSFLCSAVRDATNAGELQDS